MKKWLIALASCVVAAAAIVGWYLYPTVSPISVDRPLTETATLQPLSASHSTITLPVAIPIASFTDHINELAPKKMDGSKNLGKIAFIKLGSVSWWMQRTPINVKGKSNKLHLTSNMTGEARYKGIGVPIKGNITASTTPAIRSDWRVSVSDLQLSAHVTRARLFKVISLRSLAQSRVNQEMNNLRKNIQNQIANDTSLEKAARMAWKDICGTFLLDKNSGLWVEVKPLRLRAAQPTIDRTNVNFQLGLDAEVRIVTDKNVMSCKFPKSLVSDPPRPGRIELVLPAHTDYAWLTDLLTQRVRKDIDVEGVSVQIRSIGLRPHGEALLLEVGLSAQTGGWFGARGDGTIYVVARPVLDKQQQTIVLSDLGLDTESSNVLVSIFGEVMEPVILNALEKSSTIDLKPQLEDIRAKADGMFDAVSQGGFKLDGQVESIELSRIEVGRDKLRVVAKMSAAVSGTMRNVSFGQN